MSPNIYLDCKHSHYTYVCLMQNQLTLDVYKQFNMDTSYCCNLNILVVSTHASVTKIAQSKHSCNSDEFLAPQVK